MAAGPIERRVDDIVRRCHVGLDVATLEREVLSRLRDIVTVDAAFFATVDPATMLFTSAFSEDPLKAAAPLFLDNELAGEDVNRFVDLAATAEPVSSLDRATAGRRSESARYREIMAPLGLGDELRVALRSGGQGACWGVMCLHRQDASSGFGDRDVAIVGRIAPHVGEGLRRAFVAGMARETTSGRGPGIVVVDEGLSVVSMNPPAEAWLAEMAETGRGAEGGEGTQLPVAVQAAVTRLALLESGEDPLPTAPAVRVRTRHGQWLSVHASPLHGPTGRQTAVVIEPATSSQMTSLVLDAHAVTPAQGRVVSLVLRGFSTQQIVNELGISAHTVQEHLKAVFDKLGVGSRRELAAALLGGPRG